MAATSKRPSMILIWSLVLAWFIVCPVGGTPGSAAEFPEKNITFICSWPPGGSTDLIARSIAKVGAKYIPKPIVVVNRPGANGVIGTTENVRTPADGYTILTGTTGLFTSTVLVQKKVGYKLDDFEFLVGMTDEPIVITVHPSSPYKSLNEFIRGFKEKNQVVRYSNSGLGGIPQLCAAYLFQFAKMKSQAVPFKGGGPAMTAILGAHVDVGVAHPGEALPHMKAGKLRVLAISSPGRFGEMPDVPTFKELGYDFDMGVRKYIFAPKGLPEATRKYLVENLTKIIQDPEFKNTIMPMAIMWAPMTGKEIADHLGHQYTIMKRIVEELGIAEK